MDQERERVAFGGGEGGRFDNPGLNVVVPVAAFEVDGGDLGGGKAEGLAVFGGAGDERGGAGGGVYHCEDTVIYETGFVDEEALFGSRSGERVEG